MKYFVDKNKEIYVNVDGSVNKPYKSLNDLLNNIDCNDDCQIFLGNGTYEIDDTLLSKGENCIISIKGKNDKTVLIQTNGWFSNSCGGNNNFTLNISNLIYNIKQDLIQENLNYIHSNLNFHNIVFDSIPNNKYSVFLPYKSTINFYNCTKTHKTENFLRCTDGNINTYDCYGCFTSGYNTKQLQWDTKGNLITKQTNLNDKFKILDRNINSKYGVYSGFHSWNKYKFLLEQNNKLYTIKSEFYDLLKGQYKPITEIDINNITDADLRKYGFDDIGDILTETTEGDEKFKPINKLKSINDGQFKVIVKELED